MNEDFALLASELRAAFGSRDLALDDAGFAELALRVFRFQVRWNAVYAKFCVGRGVEPASVADWREIPPVPTSAFKTMPIFCGDPGTAETVFRTSGTSQGGGVRGEHYVADLSLYEASALSNFERHVLPDGVRPALVGLVPDPELLSDSSLSHMAGLVGRELCESTAFCSHPERGVDFQKLASALSAAVEFEVPVLLFGTAFAFVHWTDHLQEARSSFDLPTGSRIMETGGFKGRSREVARESLYAALSLATGVAVSHIVNEYGMTEMLSQFYEPIFHDDETPLADRYHVGPGWVRTRVLDPATLEEVPDGTTGILAHFDLANLGSVSAVLTEDRGLRVGAGFRLLGRTPGAEPRGCSLSMEELLRAREQT